MILLRKSPGASEDNALQISVASGFDPSDAPGPIVVAAYKYVGDVGTVTEAANITLGGVKHSFPSTIALGTQAGAALLEATIRKILFDLGYTNNDISVTLSGTTLTIETALSELSFDTLHAIANPFEVKAARSHGDYKGAGDKADTVVGARVIADTLEVSIGATVGVTNVAVTGTNVTSYDASAPAGIAQTPHAIPAAGNNTISVVVTYSDETTATFPVVVTNY